VSTVATQSPPIDAMLELVDRLVAELAGQGLQAGPAGVQESVGDLLVSDEVVGCSLGLDDGSVLAVMASVTGLGQLAGTEDLSAAVESLVPRLTALAAEVGLAVTDVSPISDRTEVPGGLEPVAGLRSLVGAGLFDGDTAVASVGVCGSTVQAAPAKTALRSPGISAGTSRNIHLLADVTLAVTAQLGSTTMTMGGLLDLQPGGVIELDREAGSPIDLLVNGTLVARGEVVVSEGWYAVRVTEVVAEDEQR
jgi:flagellar motor switch protein FliN/FliY